jgi:hypothetical protein
MADRCARRRLSRKIVVVFIRSSRPSITYEGGEIAATASKPAHRRWPPPGFLCGANMPAAEPDATATECDRLIRPDDGHYGYCMLSSQGWQGQTSAPQRTRRTRDRRRDHREGPDNRRGHAGAVVACRCGRAAAGFAPDRVITRGAGPTQP